MPFLDKKHYLYAYQINIPMKRLYIVTVLALCSVALCAQTSREFVAANPCVTGGVYYAYPTTEAVSTPAPKGYRPFYISHYGRHGSRWLISPKDYTSMIDVMERADKAGALTSLGKDVLRRLNIIYEDAKGLEGELTPVGVKQHRGIAERMYANYGDVFSGNARVLARSTVVVRCVLSMAAFCERLKELNPQLNLTRETGQRFMGYLCGGTKEADEFKSHDNPWYETYKAFEASHTHPDRLVASLFADNTYVEANVAKARLMRGLFAIAGDLQNTETGISLYDIFTADELFDLWQIGNFYNYVTYGPAPVNGGLIAATAKNLLSEIIESADKAIADGGNGATLRFGHDGNITPLVALMHLEDGYGQQTNPELFYSAWCNFQVSPMASNVQIVFFRNKDGDVIVKFLHNEREVAIPIETDIAPYYHWDSVKSYFKDIISSVVAKN